MVCLVCGRDVGEDGTHHAVALDTNGNYGSTVLDNDGIVRLSVCDHCLIERRDRLRLLVKKRCKHCNGDHQGFDLLEVLDDTIPRAKPSNLPA